MPGSEKKEPFGIAVKRELLSRLYNYISHSLHVWEHSQIEGAAQKLEFTHKCYKFVENININTTLFILCNLIVQKNRDLLQILPSETNTSYNTSVSMLNEIMNFCYSVTNYKVENHG